MKSIEYGSILATEAPALLLYPATTAEGSKVTPSKVITVRLFSSDIVEILNLLHTSTAWPLIVARNRM